MGEDPSTKVPFEDASHKKVPSYADTVRVRMLLYECAEPSRPTSLIPGARFRAQREVGFEDFVQCERRGYPAVLAR